MNKKENTRISLNHYNNWFSNLSFFKYNTFILDHINDIWSMINNFLDKIYNSNLGRVEGRKYTSADLETVKKLSQTFLDNHKINLNIESLEKNNILIFDSYDKVPSDNYTNGKAEGKVFKDENNNWKILVYESKTISDSLILVHELMHYYNQPNGERNFVSDMLTESISYACEMIFLEDMLKNDYSEDADYHSILFAAYMFHLFDNFYPVYKMAYLYKNKNHINKKNYTKLFNDDKYEKMLSNFGKYADLHRSIVRDTWFNLGFPLAMYMLESYKKDSNFFDLILKFNDSINEKSYEECLSIIGINNSEEFYSRLDDAFDSFIGYLNNIFKSKEKVLKK